MVGGGIARQNLLDSSSLLNHALIPSRSSTFRCHLPAGISQSPSTRVCSARALNPHRASSHSNLQLPLNRSHPFARRLLECSHLPRSDLPFPISSTSLSRSLQYSRSLSFEPSAHTTDLPAPGVPPPINPGKHSQTSPYPHHPPFLQIQ